MLTEVYKSTIKLLKQLGYKTQGMVYPRVEVEQPNEDAGLCKDNSDAECELLLDVVSRGTSPAESLSIASNIKNNIHLVTSNEIDIFGVSVVNQNGVHEYGDTEEVYRQLLRVRFNTSKK